MTTAMCFNCGAMKFGAFCPCTKCGVDSCGDHDLDILFSSHRMSVATLKRFGKVIQQIAARCDDPDIRFWAFISYVSEHPSQMLWATPPAEFADGVKKLLAYANLPVVVADLKPVREETGPPPKILALPDGLLRAYLKVNKFFVIDRIQVRRRDGTVINGDLMETDGVPQLMVNADVDLISNEIVAMRKAPGCLVGWFVAPRWIEVSKKKKGRA